MGALFGLLATAVPGWPLALPVLTIGHFFYTLVNLTSAAVLDIARGTVQASAMGLTSLLTQAIVLPAPVLAGWLVERFVYGSAFVLAAAFMWLGELRHAPAPVAAVRRAG